MGIWLNISQLSPSAYPSNLPMLLAMQGLVYYPNSPHKFELITTSENWIVESKSYSLSKATRMVDSMSAEVDHFSRSLSWLCLWLREAYWVFLFCGCGPTWVMRLSSSIYPRCMFPTQWKEIGGQLAPHILWELNRFCMSATKHSGALVLSLWGYNWFYHLSESKDLLNIDIDTF